MSTPSNPPAGGNGDGIGIGVTRLPTCEYCLDRAEYQGLTTFRRQSFMCARHFRQHGQGLGAGRGFPLVAMPDPPQRP